MIYLFSWSHNSPCLICWGQVITAKLKFDQQEACKNCPKLYWVIPNYTDTFFCCPKLSEIVAWYIANMSLFAGQNKHLGEKIQRVSCLIRFLAKLESNLQYSGSRFCGTCWPLRWSCCLYSGWSKGSCSKIHTSTTKGLSFPNHYLHHLYLLVNSSF